MTRARTWSLRLRDLSAIAAFLSMAISGELPAWVVGLYTVSAVLSLIGIRALTRLGKASLLLLVLAAFGLYSAVARGSLDLVIAASSFAALLTAHRQLSETTSSTDDQVLLVGLLMICGGASLSGEMLYAVFLTLFAVLGALSRGLSLLDEVNEDADLSLRPAVGQLLRGSLIAMVGAVAFFVLFPRLSWNVAARTQATGLGPASSGFSNSVRLGGSGALKTNPRPVFRVKLSPDPRRDELDIYWMGRALETFDGMTWNSPSNAQVRLPRMHLEDGEHDRIVRQDIEVLPAMGSTIVPMMERAVAVGPAIYYSRSGRETLMLARTPDVDVRVGREVNAFTVSVLSTTSQSGAALPRGDISRFLQIPPSLDPRIKSLAQSIVGTERRPTEAARALRDYLLKNYTYTLDLEEGDGRDPLAHFLFVRKAGHCEYFATALTLMLRTLGIPSRVATGFFGGSRTENGYVLRAGDAHAWTQVLVPEVGFVTMDATPPDHRGGTPSPWLTFALRVYERADAFWKSGVVDFSIFDQARMVRSMSEAGRGSSRNVSAPSSSPRAMVSLGIGALVLGVGWFLTGKKSRSRAHPATQLLESVEKALAHARVPGHGDVPAEELVQTLPSDHPLFQPARNAMRRYLAARYGHSPLLATEQRTLAAAVQKAARETVSAGVRMDRA
jgi:hypothetical protein